MTGREIVERLSSLYARHSNIHAVLTRIVDAGDRLKECLGLSSRPNLFQDLHDDWKKILDDCELIRDAMDEISRLTKERDEAIEALLERTAVSMNQSKYEAKP